MSDELKTPPSFLIYEIERKRRELLNLVTPAESSRSQFLHISSFYSYLLDLNLPVQTYTYIIEFLEIWSEALTDFTPFFADPEITSDLLELVSSITLIDIPEHKKEELKKQLIRIQMERELLDKILAGVGSSEEPGIFFPLIDPGLSGAGILETVSISLDKGKAGDEFIIVPSEAVIEKRLRSQVEASFRTALDYIRQYSVKLHKTHRVIIHFKQRAGFYIGDSLGAALTVGFIESLIHHYSISYSFKINRNIAFTGGMRENRIIIPVEESIKEKVEVVFFSPVEIFSLPWQDIYRAEEKLKELAVRYPLRKLKLIPVRELQDIIDSRSLINIKKLNPAVITARNLRKYWSTYLLILVFSSILFFAGILDFDNNPSYMEYDGNYLKIKNMRGKILWDRLMEGTETKSTNLEDLRNHKILDVNGDGKNEVFLSFENLEGTAEAAKAGRLACFDSEGKLLWDFLFRDTIANAKEGITRFYRSRIIDIVEEGGRYVLYAFALHDPNYTSAIFKLDAEEGIRIPGVLWNPGHYSEIFIHDYGRTGTKQFIAAGINNAMESVFIFSINLSEMSKTHQAYSTTEYWYENIPLANFNRFLSIPKTDLSILKNQRYNWLPTGGLSYISKQEKFQLGVREGLIDEYGAILYYFDPSLQNISIEIGDYFRVIRDSLVSNGTLKPPYSDTRSYKELLLSNIKSYK